MCPRSVEGSQVKASNKHLANLGHGTVRTKTWGCLASVRGLSEKFLEPVGEADSKRDDHEGGVRLARSHEHGAAGNM